MQNNVPLMAPMTALRRRSTEVIDKLSDERPTIITNNGLPVAVMLTWKAWADLVDETNR